MLRQAKKLLIDFAYLLYFEVFLIAYTITSQFNLLSTFALSLGIFLLIYWLFQPVDYLPATLKSIKLGALGCPEVVEEKMKELTQDGQPINRIIIEIVDKEVSLSQTGIYNKVVKKGIDLSRTRVNEYIDALVDSGLLNVEPREKKKGVEKTYQLTEQGKWFLKVSRACFPRTRIGFLITYTSPFHKKLPNFPVKPPLPETTRPIETATG